MTGVVHEALRRWAEGLPPLEAGVGLLIRSSDGRFANPGQPWVRRGDDAGWWWIDVEQMDEANDVAFANELQQRMELGPCCCCVA